MILRGNFFSRTLELHTGITIVTSNISSTRNHYKVAYLLHGLSGNNDNWTDYTMLPVYAREYETIFIMPEAARSFYTDMKFGYKYLSYITEELPTIAKKIFNISTRREDTAIIGNSMGGYGALLCALSKPEQYGVCCAFSPVCLFLKEYLDKQRKQGETRGFKTFFGEQLLNDFKSIFGEDLEWNSEYELLELAKNADNHPIKPKIFMACGTEDYLINHNIRFSDEMKKLDFDFTFQKWTGAHDWYFFNEALYKALKTVI